MKLTIALVNGDTIGFTNENAMAVESAIDRAVKLGDLATNNIKLSDGSLYRLFINSIIDTAIEY